MSRVGKMPITVPQGVDVQITAEQITVKGGNATLVRAANPLVTIEKEGATITFVPVNDSVAANAMSGTMRARVWRERRRRCCFLVSMSAPYFFFVSLSTTRSSA